ncbi:MAG: A24 family peptidase [Nanoarchaeota archaeon]|nr:A24 family peptidase [Nanoarchaeota archaeon]MBU1322204.1 A24 family peptidase [Nanoarchaeota archaeon]MBU1597745.1 A24 family peptidase [Nanoarchaeota archaeon]MBU2442009.1 A24 family peptidase [Nanoarchaeota archaeon]
MLWPGYIGLSVGLLVLIVASISDIKTREVPDWLNFGLIAFAIGGSVILSIYHGYIHIFWNAVIGLAAGLVIGLVMFYSGQWGGGDSKLIFGLSALIGLSLSDFSRTIPLLVMFFINILLVGAIYGLFFTIIKAAAHYKAFKEAADIKSKTKKIIITRILFLILGVLSFIFLLATRSNESIILFGFVVVLFIFFYLWLFVSLVEKVCMIQQMKVKDLTEGEWIINPVKKANKIILHPTKIGITMKQIALLKRHKIQNVTIKVGIPFVPSFLIAYVLTFIFGNWLMFLL